LTEFQSEAGRTDPRDFTAGFNDDEILESGDRRQRVIRRGKTDCGRATDPNVVDAQQLIEACRRADHVGHEVAEPDEEEWASADHLKYEGWRKKEEEARIGFLPSRKFQLDQSMHRNRFTIHRARGSTLPMKSTNRWPIHVEVGSRP
jgi:hypothetical protein